MIDLLEEWFSDIIESILRNLSLIFFSFAIMSLIMLVSSVLKGNVFWSCWNLSFYCFHITVSSYIANAENNNKANVKQKCLHKWDNLITGFRYDGAAIGRCENCRMPIVIEHVRCTPYVSEKLNRESEDDVLRLSEEMSKMGLQAKEAAENLVRLANIEAR
jgi:hypothetical protein